MKGDTHKMRVKGTYDIDTGLAAWLKVKAAAEGRAVIRQIEKILEDARKRDQEAAQ